MAIHLLHIIEIFHTHVDGTILYENYNIPNIFHQQGQQFVLSATFNTASAITVPANYRLGLDNRATLSDADTLENLIAEPAGFGYTRQPVSSLNGFSISLGTGGKYQATTNTVTFTASGGTWGPVQNLFLTTTIDNSGFLISSAALRSSRTVTSGQSITMRLAVSLGNC